MVEERLHAVLSGDIVGSRRFADRGPAVRDAIKIAYRACADEFGDELQGVDVFRGDSWQVLVRSPGLALRIGLLMWALIKSSAELPGADTRLAIGIGGVEFVDRDNLSESQGEAFTLSGEALDSLRDSKLRMAARVPDSWSDDAGLLEPQATLDMAMALVDAISRHWTSSQAAAVARALMDLEQVRIAEELSISQSAVSQTLSSARWSAVEQAVGWWERAIQGHPE